MIKPRPGPGGVFHGGVSWPGFRADLPIAAAAGILRCSVNRTWRCGTVRRYIFALLFATLAPSLPAGADPVLHESFEGSLNPAFIPCQRPEGTIAVSGERARSGRQAMRLSIEATPFGTASWLPKSTSCLISGRENEYESDATERAELWENFDYSPRFGEDLHYGFSMWIGRESAPLGDPTRLVIGQWKAPVDDSPFLAQRFTGGAFHVTLDVDAATVDPANGRRYGCKVLLAFDRDLTIPEDGATAALDRKVQCEATARSASSLQPAFPLAIERFAYLPPVFDRWVDLVYRVRGGADGLVEVWADGRLIARATGYIGHEGALGQRQYFKFGPYRDPASYASSVYLDNLARGRRYEDVALAP